MVKANDEFVEEHQKLAEDFRLQQRVFTGVNLIIQIFTQQISFPIRVP